MSLFQKTYQKMCRKKSYAVWHHKEKSQQRIKNITLWYKRISLLSEEQIQNISPASIPIIPGDELFNLGNGNILELALMSKQYSLLRLLVKKGLSGSIACVDHHQPCPFALSDFINATPVISVSITPLPISKAVYMNDDKALGIFLSDLTGLSTENNPFLPLYEQALVSSSFDCLNLLLEKKFATQVKNNILHVTSTQLINWETDQQLIESTPLFLKAVKLVPHKDLDAFFSVIKNHTNTHHELCHKTLGIGPLVLRQAILRNNKEACLFLLTHGVCPNEPYEGSMAILEPLARYPLYMASFGTEPEMIDLLLRFGATWEHHGLCLGDAILLAHEKMKRDHPSLGYLGRTIPKALPYAQQCYETHKRSLALHQEMTSLLLPPRPSCEEHHRKM